MIILRTNMDDDDDDDDDDLASINCWLRFNVFKFRGLEYHGCIDY